MIRLPYEYLNNRRRLPQYMQAILNARLGNEQRAVSLLLSAAEVDDRIRFRANLDPELSLLVKKYGLFKEDDLW